MAGKHGESSRIDEKQVRTAERTAVWKMKMKEVVDSVLGFPYACAIQYKRVRGRTLLPGSEWDRV